MILFKSAVRRGGLACLWLTLTAFACLAQTSWATGNSMMQQGHALTLDEAISLATANEPAFAAAQARVGESGAPVSGA